MRSQFELRPRRINAALSLLTIFYSELGTQDLKGCPIRQSPSRRTTSRTCRTASLSPPASKGTRRPGRPPYKLIVDGQPIADGFAESLGSLRFKFSTEPGSLPLGGALSPVTTIRHVQLQDRLGRTVLQGDFMSDGPVLEPPAGS